MNDRTTTTEHAAVDELLPWYVNGTLADGERERVRHHVAGCATCTDNLRLLNTVDSTLSQTAATPIMPARNPDALLARIDAGDRGARRGRTLAVSLAAAAAVALVAVLWLPDREPAGAPGIYETATSGTPGSTMHYVVDLAFDPAIEPVDRESILTELDAVSVRPDAAGSYRVTIGLPAISLSELEAYTQALEARPGVTSARVVAVQLPMERKP